MAYLPDDERFRLLYGPYNPPRVRRGDALQCEIEGLSIVGGYHDAPVLWPYRLRTGLHSLIVHGELVRAVQQESEIGVAHHWGICRATVQKWRRALGVGRITDGTERLYEDYSPIKLTEEVVSRPKPEGFRQKMRASAVQRGWHPTNPDQAPWAPEEDKLLGTDLDRMVAGILGRTEAGVQLRRHRLGIPSFGIELWTPDEDKLLGTNYDRSVAQILGRTKQAVQRRRYDLRIPAFPGPTRKQS